MALFENPIQLAKQVKELFAAVSRWQQRLRLGDIDETGPYLGRPPLTEREAFRVIAELREPEPIRRAWSRWAFRLSEARVNAQVLAAIAREYRVELHTIEKPEPTSITLRELLHRALERRRERLVWLPIFGAEAAQLRRLTVAEFVRRNEMARRAGFGGVAELTAPITDPSGFAEQLLSATDDLYREVVPTNLEGWLDAALAIRADRGWPAQLNPRTIRQLLGTKDWYDGLDLPARQLPSAMAASSFVRSLYELGVSIQLGALPPRELFVLACDPYGLFQHTVGSLVAQLASSSRWQSDLLSLSRSRAVEQARTVRVSQLIAARTRALCVLLEDRAIHGEAALQADFEEVCHRALGFSLPRDFTGILPRLRVDSVQRLVGQCLASRWTQRLVAEFDVDWYRNPRGVEAVRDQLSQVAPTLVEADEAAASLASFVESCTAESFD